MDNIDNIIENVLQREIYEPYEFKQAILTAFETKRKNSIYLTILIKIISSITAFILIVMGIVFAKDISNWIYDIFNPASTGTGVIKMVENGYLYNTQMEYIENNDNFVKIDYIMMDDFNLNIVFDVKTKQKIDKAYMIEISDLIILDENKNIIFCSYNNDVYKEYCKENGLKYEKDWVLKNHTNSGYQTEIIEKSDNNIKFIYKMYSSIYPRSKELFINFGNINIIPTIESVTSDEKITIDGKWNLKFELPQEFYNREIIKYNVEGNTDKENGVNIEEITASYTEMHVSLKIKNATNPINNVKEDVENRLLTILEGNENDEIVQHPTIENENGEIFKISTATREGNFSKIYRKNGDLDIHIIFPLTKYDYTNNLKLKMILKGNEICINLKKSLSKA